MTEAEEKAFTHQLGLAIEHELPVLVHTPHRDKLEGTKRTLDVVRESGIDPSLVVVDHLNEVTVGLVAESGCWMGFSIYPDTKMDEHRMVAILKEYGTERMLVNSAADWGRSDPLKTYRTGKAMLEADFSESDVDKVLWENPVEFYGQSGKLILDPLPESTPNAETFEGQFGATRREEVNRALVLYERPPRRGPRRHRRATRHLRDPRSGGTRRRRPGSGPVAGRRGGLRARLRSRGPGPTGR
jgi:hypothetical protein